jgi:hypothetical protein
MKRAFLGGGGKKFKKNELFSLFLSGTPLLRAITVPGGMIEDPVQTGTGSTPEAEPSGD